jgi:hypothetical protein
MKKNWTKRWTGLSCLVAGTLGSLLGAPAHAASPFSNITSSSKFCIYYGDFSSPATLTALEAYDVVVINPNVWDCTPATVATLHNAGVKYVIGYISIGEDAASAASQGGPGTPITGDGLGPVYYSTTTNSIVQENKGVASFYVDQSWNGTSYVSDNAADTNPSFGGYYIDPNTAWQSILKSEKITTTSGTRSCAGLDQIAGVRSSDTDTTRTDNYGFDGFFLDTLDTAGPYTNPGWYPWAAKDMSACVQYIHTNYSGKMVLANRGMFFYNPDITNTTFNVHPYDYCITPYVNGALTESYYLDSDFNHMTQNPSWNDNDFDNGRKLTAEANRPDGFTVFCLDYQCVLSNNKPFNYTVTAVNSSGVESAASNEICVVPSAATTGTGGAPGAPYGIVAASGNNQIKLSWTAPTGATSYNVLRGTSPNSETSLATGIASATYTDTTAANGTMYYYKITATNSSGTSPLSSEVNEKPAAANSGAPTGLTATASTNQAALSWSSVSGATSYNVYRTVTAGSYGDSVPVTGVSTTSFTDAGRQSSYYSQALTNAIVNKGWTEYQATDGNLSDVNNYVKNNLPAADTAAPTWSSTQTPGYIAGANYTDASNPYTNLTGIQALVAGSTSGEVVAQWDLAVDQTPTIAYDIYQSPDTAFASPTEYYGVNYAVGSGWASDTTTHYANQYDVSGLTPGTYYFRVRAKDALGHEDTNTVTQGPFVVAPGQVSNPVLDGAITVDGALTDWSNIRSFGTKPADLTGATNPVDWSNAYMANDTNKVYLAVTNANSLSSLTSAETIYLDTDQSRSTGYIGGGSTFPIGAEYMIQGGTLYKYTGTGTNWSWGTGVAVTTAVSGTNIEYSIPRSYIGNPTRINFFLYGDNTGTSGSVDYYPINATSSTGGKCIYNLVDTYNPVTTTAITVDGSLSDWSALKSFGTKSSDVSGASNPVNWELGYAAHDGTNVYIAFENYNSIGTLDSKYTIYLDTDNNPTTGFRGGSGNFPVGAEYMVQGTTLYHYTGTGLNWSWSSVGSVTSSVSGGNAEIKFAASSIGSPSIMRMFFYGDNTGSGGVVDTYPANALQSNGTGNFVAYRLDDVSNSATITVDGNLSDWSSLRPYPLKQADTNGATDPLDFLQGWTANDSSNFYFAIQNANTFTLNWGTTLYIDTDCNRSTGYIGGGSNFPVGAEYMIQGGTLYPYTGTGTNWSWGTGVAVTTAVSGTNVEYSVAKTSLGSPSLFKFFIYGDNTAFTGGTVIDTYPAGALVTGGGGPCLTYRTH